MDTQAIINAINNIQLHNDDQVMAYDEDDFIALCIEETEEQFGGDDVAMAECDGDKIELLHKIREAQDNQEKSLIVICLFDGSNASEKIFIIK